MKKCHPIILKISTHKYGEENIQINHLLGNISGRMASLASQLKDNTPSPESQIKTTSCSSGTFSKTLLHDSDRFLSNSINHHSSIFH